MAAALLLCPAGSRAGGFAGAARAGTAAAGGTGLVGAGTAGVGLVRPAQLSVPPAGTPFHGPLPSVSPRLSLPSAAYSSPPAPRAAVPSAGAAPKAPPAGSGWTAPVVERGSVRGRSFRKAVRAAEGKGFEKGGRRASAALSSLFDGGGKSSFVDASMEGMVVAPGSIVLPDLARVAGLSRISIDLRREIGEVVPALAASLKARGKSLSGKACGTAAPALAWMLRRMGREAHVVDAEMHVYLLYEAPEGRIIIDPTVRQFFGGERAPSDIPSVFVGTAGELNDLFKAHAESKSTKYGVDRIYFSQARVRDRLLDEETARIDAASARLRGEGGKILTPEEDEDMRAYEPILEFDNGRGAETSGRGGKPAIILP